MKKRIFNVLYYVCIFLGLLSFFYLAHPMIIFNTDDWHFASYWRRPLPIPGGYNGIKVFPETFMSLVSEIGLYAVYPFAKDYLMSLAFAYAVAVSLFIIAFVFLLERFLKQITNDDLVSKGISFLVLIFHFLIYKNDCMQNHHLFYAQDVTCVFHYTLSALLNICIVLFLLSEEIIVNRSLSKDILEGKYSAFKAGFLVLAIYLAIYSSMFHNIILASFSGGCLIVELILNVKRKEFKIVAFVRANWIHLMVCIMWISTLIMQLMDPRNEDAKKQEMKAGFVNTIKAFMGQVTSINKFLILFIGIIIMAIVARIIVNGPEGFVRRNGKAFISVILPGFATTLYLIILASVAGKDYISREDVLIGIFDYVFIIISMLMTGLFTDTAHKNGSNDAKSNKAMIIFPLMIFLLTSQTLNYCKSYADYNIFGLSWEETYAAGNDIIEQIIEAENQGIEELDLYVTDNEGWNNIWPYTSYVGTTIADTLYRHGIIAKPIKVNAVYDKKKNEELNIHY